MPENQKTGKQATAQAVDLQTLVSSCDICLDPCGADLLKHLPVYVFGSEGIRVCNICQQAITDYIRSMRCVAGRAHKQGYLSFKSKSDSNC